jgi:soluble lytic murein transglycosylase-like protein
MSKGPSLVLRGMIIGCLVVGFLGYWMTSNLKISAKTEVAYAAAAPTSAGQNDQVMKPVEPDQTCQVSHSYPQSILQWCESITHFADQAGLSPNLVAAVMLQESGGDASAFSASGAVGLMQVMPRDGIAANFECINGPCFASRPTIQELMDPSYNIEYGTRMLAGLITRLGDLRQALKAYGPMNVGYSYADTVLVIDEHYR